MFGNENHLSLSDLMDIQLLQDFQDKFAKAMNVASINVTKGVLLQGQLILLIFVQNIQDAAPSAKKTALNATFNGAKLPHKGVNQLFMIATQG